MKIRSGFVSNSSSSSFCIYGVYMDTDELVEKMKNAGNLSEEELEQLDDEGSWYIQELLYGKMDNLSIYESEGDCWIGRDFTTIGDDETGKQFKESVEQNMEKLLGEKVDCEIHEEEIYS